MGQTAHSSIPLRPQLNSQFAAQQWMNSAQTQIANYMSNTAFEISSRWAAHNANPYQTNTNYQNSSSQLSLQHNYNYYNNPFCRTGQQPYFTPTDQSMQSKMQAPYTPYPYQQIIDMGNLTMPVPNVSTMPGAVQPDQSLFWPSQNPLAHPSQQPFYGSTQYTTQSNFPQGYNC